MNKETVEGKFDQAAGAIKQKVGETFGNQKLANSGVADQIKGAAKETWGNAKDVASDSRDDAAVQAGAEKESLTQRAEEAAHNIRERLVNATQNAKNNINEKLDEIKERHDRA
jgi:uncharacterized protein YjbJ (UPF0337 family)